jgi:S-formylglutathione hydrolase FrmB
VYLLHGYSGNYRSWIAGAKGFEKAADTYQIIIVCPDGNNRCYWDSPVDDNYKYETYVSTELVSWIDNKYKTIKDKKGRAITGLSMAAWGIPLLNIRMFLASAAV